MKKVFLLYQATGQHNDKLISVHENKGSAIKAKSRNEEKLINQCKAVDVVDFYITERYVIDN